MANDKKRPLVSKSSLIIRVVAGMYLIYLAYELLMGLNASEGAPVGVAIGAAVIFAIFGIVLVAVSGRAFLKGNFQGGIMDVSEQENVSGEE